MKRFLALLLSCLLLFAGMPAAVMAADAGSQSQDAYIDLSGEWNYKLYRKYSNMFQYFASEVGVDITWEDEDAAAVPAKEVYGEWETVNGPNADYSTGGLLQMLRDTELATEDDRTQLLDNDMFPKWAEAWWCKTVEIPEGFLEEETVTLLLGIIDDMDVVYVNGEPVAASGFVDSDGAKADVTLVPELGGFDAEGDFRFEKSYWEVPRVYSLDANLFQEGENEIAIRLYNNNSYGGFYDRPMALTANAASLRALQGLPVDALADSADYEALIDAQTAAIEGKDIDAYADTLWEGYNENELDKAEQVALMQGYFDAYDEIRVEDTDAGFYTYENAPVYSGRRVITGVNGGEETALFSDAEYIAYFTEDGGDIVERGNLSYCYTVTYASSLEEMNGRQLLYSVYLPPSYYSSPNRSYPVVYLLHGINSTGDSFVNVDHIEARMNEMINSGAVTEMIVVMPNSGKSSGYRDTEAPDGVNDSAGPWASHISVDILNQIETNYRAIAAKEFRAVSGISMGGGGVFRVGVANPDIYTSFASHMGAVSEAKETIDLLDPEIIGALDFYLDCGLDDRMVDPAATRETGEYLTGLGADVIWELRGGGHNSAFYMDGIPVSMAMHSQHFLENGLFQVRDK